MRKLRNSVIAVAAATTLLLSACGGGTTDNKAADKDDNTLTVWTWDPAFNIYAMKEAEKVYQETHPDFKLNIVETPWDDVQSKIITLHSPVKQTNCQTFS